MKWIVVFSLLSLSGVALAGEGYVTCRQKQWQTVPGADSVLSLKSRSCVRVSSGFFDFETLEIKARRLCQEWQSTHEVEQLKAQLFADQISCTRDQRSFYKTQSSLRPVMKETFDGSVEFLLYQDASQPYFDEEAGRERARWAQLEDQQWYCALPGQNFYARYEYGKKETGLVLRDLSGNSQSFQLQLQSGDLLLWGRLSSSSFEEGGDVHSVENGNGPQGHNGFELKDAAGRVRAAYRMNYLLDLHRDPLMSCY